MENKLKTMETGSHSKNRTNPKTRMVKTFLAMMCFVLLTGAFIFTGCKKDKPNNEVPQNVVELIQAAGLLPEPPPAFPERSDLISTHSQADTVEVGSNIHITEWVCETIKYSASDNPNDFFMFNPLASVLWPGNLVQGKSIESGIPTSIPVSKRQPGNITLTIVSSAGNTEMSRTVDKMQLSSVNQAMNDILSGFSGHGYAKYEFDMEFIEDASSLNFKLRAGYSGGVANASAVFGINWSQNRTRMLVKLHQQYFTMAYDDPHGFDGVFTPDITVRDLENYTGTGNPICYISSVTYGRVYYLLYESTASKTELEAALNIKYGGAELSTNLEYNNTMNRTTVKIRQIGGNAADGLSSATMPTKESVQTFLDNGANFSPESPGAPISYTVKHLRDASLVRMNNTMEYEISQCDTVTIIPPTGTFDLSTGEWTNGTSNAATFSNNVLTVNNGASIVVTSNGVNTMRHIVVNGEANIRLSDVSITGLSANQSPMLLNSGANLTLTLVGSNTFEAGPNSAGIQTSQSTVLTIQGSGNLMTTGGSGGAGIGGNRGADAGPGADTRNESPAGGAGGSCGRIIINSGRVTATGGDDAAGIGGGRGGNGGRGSHGGITFTGFLGAPVTHNCATGGRGGNGGNGGTITIKDGATVMATGRGGGMNIGGGAGGIGGGGGTNTVQGVCNSGSSGSVGGAGTVTGNYNQ